MPHVATSTADLLSTIQGAAHLDGDVLVIDDEPAFRTTAIRDLAWTAAFSTDDATTAAAQWIVWEASQALGAHERQHPGAVHGPRPRRGHRASRCRRSTCAPRRSTWPGPSSRRPSSADVGAVIFEIARSEQTYTFQRPIDFATSVLAGAIAAGWRAPVFIQGDHYQFNAKKYAADPEAMTEEIRRACRLAVDAGYRNIDIDSSTLVDLSKPTVDEQQRENYRRAAELTALIRTLEADGVTDQRRWRDRRGRHAELDGRGAARLPRRLPARARATRAPGAIGLSKVSVQTGTSHGGVPLPDGGVAEVKLDFEVLRELGEVARSTTGWQARCSTARRRCPTSCSIASRRSRPPRSTSRPASRTRSTSTPRSRRTLQRRIEAWCFENAADERKAGQTDEQFVYTTRKKAIGPFKRELWDLPTKDEILAAQRRKFSFLFTELGVNGSREMVGAYIRPVEAHRPLPDALRERRRR